MKSTTTTRIQIAALGLALCAAAAHAQTTTAPTSSTGAYDANRTSWIPYTRSGYMGLNVGRSNYGTNCGALALRCDDSDTAGRIYLGGYFNPWLGAEIGYMDLGDTTRGGGRTSAHGLNLSLVARAPLTDRFAVYGKLGTTYSRTRVDALAGSGIASGRESGWGPAYALGVNYALTSNWSALLEFDRQRLDFAGNNREWVRTTSIGVQYHF